VLPALLDFGAQKRVALGHTAEAVKHSRQLRRVQWLDCEAHCADSTVADGQKCAHAIATNGSLLQT
jgi:hypothetical protein